MSRAQAPRTTTARNIFIGASADPKFSKGSGAAWVCVRATHAPAPAPLCLQVPRKVPHRDASSTTNANLRGCNMAQSRSVRHASLHPSIVEIPCRHLSVPALAISPRLICNTNVVVVIGLTHCSGCHLSSPTLLVTIHPHPYSRVPGENSAPFASRATHDFGLH